MEGKKKPGAYNGYTLARKAANAKYEADTVERVSLVMPKGTRLKYRPMQRHRAKA